MAERPGIDDSTAIRKADERYGAAKCSSRVAHSRRRSL